MPQLDFGTFLSQIFWMFLSYSLLYLFVSKYITKAIFSIKDSRQKKILSDSGKLSMFCSEIEDIQRSLINLKLEISERESSILSESKKSFAAGIIKEQAKIDRKTKKTIQNHQVSMEEDLNVIQNKLQGLYCFHANFLLKKLISRKVDEESLKKIERQ